MPVATKPSMTGKKRSRHQLPPVPPHANGLGGLGEIAAELKALGPEAEDFFRKLALVNEFTLWKECSREACRRVGKCRGENAECFDEQRYQLKRSILRVAVWMMCTAEVSSEEFYDYLDEVTDEEAEDDER